MTNLKNLQGLEGLEFSEELQYAVECGVKFDVKVLENGDIQVSWNNGQCVEILSLEETIESEIEIVETATFENKLVELFGEVKTTNKAVQSLLKNKLIEARYSGNRYYFKVEGHKNLNHWEVITCSKNGKVVMSNNYSYDNYAKLI